jgi:hypothetical protein
MNGVTSGEDADFTTKARVAAHADRTVGLVRCLPGASMRTGYYL